MHGGDVCVEALSACRHLNIAEEARDGDVWQEVARLVWSLLCARACTRMQSATLFLYPVLSNLDPYFFPVMHSMSEKPPRTRPDRTRKKLLCAQRSSLAVK